MDRQLTASLSGLDRRGLGWLKPPAQAMAPMTWFTSAILGVAVLAATGPSAPGAGAGILAAGVSLAWMLLGSRPGDYAILAEVAARHRVEPVQARRLWPALNAPWRNPRQYEAIVLDTASQYRRLHLAPPPFAGRPVRVRLSLDSSPQMQAGA